MRRKEIGQLSDTVFLTPLKYVRFISKWKNNQIPELGHSLPKSFSKEKVGEDIKRLAKDQTVI